MYVELHIIKLYTWVLKCKVLGIATDLDIYTIQAFVFTGAFAGGANQLAKQVANDCNESLIYCSMHACGRKRVANSWGHYAT